MKIYYPTTGTELQDALYSGARIIDLIDDKPYVLNDRLVISSTVSLNCYGAVIDASGIADGGAPIITADNVDDISIIGIKFIGGNASGLATGTGTRTGMMRFRNCKNLKVKETKVIQPYGQAIALQGCVYAEINNNFIYETGRDGIFLTNYGSIKQHTNSVCNNLIIRPGDDGIAVIGDLIGMTGGGAKSIDVIDNKIVGHQSLHTNLAGRGMIGFGVEDFTVRGNKVDGSFSFNLLISRDLKTTPSDSKNVLIESNKFKNAGISGNGTQPRTGLKIEHTKDVKLKVNEISESFDNGILLTNVSGFSIENMDIDKVLNGSGVVLGNFTTNGDVTNTKVTESALAGILVTPETDNINLSLNRLYDNGQNVNGTATYRSGMRIETKNIIALTNNTCKNTPGKSTQQYGINIDNTDKTVYRNDNFCFNNSIKDIETNFQATIINPTMLG